MRIREFKRTTWLRRPVFELFSFFADAANLERLTPPWLNFRILTSRPIRIQLGTLIDSRIRVHEIPFRWQSEITAWDPPRSFADEQRRGPYRFWRYEHKFVERDGGTVVFDEVQYVVPFDFLTHRLLVRPDIDESSIFANKRYANFFLALTKTAGVFPVPLAIAPSRFTARIVKIANSLGLSLASQSRACHEGHTFGPCQWLFSAPWTQIGFVRDT